MSIQQIEALGYRSNPLLPLLDDSLRLRMKTGIIERALCLHSVISVAYGFDRDRAIAWLSKENLIDCLSEREKYFLIKQSIDGAEFRYQTESLWIIAWAFNLIDELDFSLYCGDQLIDLMPDLASQESSLSFGNTVWLRSNEQLIQQCDIAYCAHWSIVDAMNRNVNPPGKIEPYAIWERRRALEWLLSDEDWDDISLDT